MRFSKNETKLCSHSSVGEKYVEISYKDFEKFVLNKEINYSIY